VTCLSESRLRWLARRGMLELDVWLNRFLDARHAQMSIAQQRLFVYLLQHDDMTLYDWMTGSVPPPPDFFDLVEAMNNLNLFDNYDSAHRHPHD